MTKAHIHLEFDYIIPYDRTSQYRQYAAELDRAVLMIRELVGGPQGGKPLTKGRPGYTIDKFLLDSYDVIE